MRDFGTLVIPSDMVTAEPEVNWMGKSRIL